MSIQRTIVQKLYESRKLEEAGFDANGSHYSCSFGRYYKDGEQITRDDYFKAKDGGSVSTGSSSQGGKVDAKPAETTPVKSENAHDRFRDGVGKLANAKTKKYKDGHVTTFSAGSELDDFIKDIPEGFSVIKNKGNDSRGTTIYADKDGNTIWINKDGDSSKIWCYNEPKHAGEKESSANRDAYGDNAKGNMKSEEEIVKNLSLKNREAYEKLEKHMQDLSPKDVGSEEYEKIKQAYSNFANTGDLTQLDYVAKSLNKVTGGDIKVEEKPKTDKGYSGKYRNPMTGEYDPSVKKQAQNANYWDKREKANDEKIKAIEADPNNKSDAGYGMTAEDMEKEIIRLADNMKDAERYARSGIMHGQKERAEAGERARKEWSRLKTALEYAKKGISPEEGILDLNKKAEKEKSKYEKSKAKVDKFKDSDIYKEKKRLEKAARDADPDSLLINEKTPEGKAYSEYYDNVYYEAYKKVSKDYNYILNDYEKNIGMFNRKIEQLESFIKDKEEPKVEEK